MQITLNTNKAFSMKVKRMPIFSKVPFPSVEKYSFTCIFFMYLIWILECTVRAHVLSGASNFRSPESPILFSDKSYPFDYQVTVA